MYCPNCGNQIDDNALFCSSCGTKLTSNNNEKSFSKGGQQNQHEDYSIYEKFGEDMMKTALKMAFAPTLVGVGTEKLIQKTLRSEDTIIKSFVITDRSIIFKNNEYPYNCMTVIAPEAIYSKEVATSVNGKKIFLKYDKADKMRLYNAIIRLNEKINQTSERQKLQYVVTISLFLKEAYEKIVSLPVTFDKDNKYDEYDFYNEPVRINNGAMVSEENQILITNFSHAQEEMNRFYKEVNPIEHAGHNRDFNVLIQLVEMMNESENDVRAVIIRYNERLQREEEARKRREEEERLRKESGYYDGIGYDSGSSGGFLRSMLSTAGGIALGNKISGNSGRSREKSQKKDYAWTSDCMKRKGLTLSCRGCRLAPYCKSYK